MKLKQEYRKGLENYLNNSGLQEVTIRKYLLYYSHFCKLFDNVLTQTYLSNWLGMKHSPNHLATAKHLINFLKMESSLTDQEKLEISLIVIQKIKGRPLRKEKSILTLLQIKKIIEECNINGDPFKTSIFKFMINFQYQMALRVGELCNLRWAWFKDAEKVGGEFYKIHLPAELTKTREASSVYLHKQYVLDYQSYLQSIDSSKGKEIYEITHDEKTLFFDFSSSWYCGWFKKECMRILGMNRSSHCLRHCLKEDCEILTLEGWKKYNEIKKGDDIYSFNIEKDSIEVKPIKKIFTYYFDGKLNNITTTNLDYSFTDEHNLVLKIGLGEKCIWGDWEKINFKDLINIKNIRNISHKLSAKFDGENSIGIERAGILGWILTDGSISRRKSPFITISQSLSANKDKCEYIENLLIKGNIPYTKKIRKSVSNYSGRNHVMCEFYILRGGNHGNNPEKKGKNHDWIFKFINIDRTPKWNLLNLRQEELKEIHKCMMLGDGTREKEFCNQNSNRIEFFRILSSFIGLNTTQGYKIQKGKKYSRIYIQNKNYCQLLLKRHLSKERYKGNVWCISNDNETFIVKSNEKIFITGNSRASHLLQSGMAFEEVQKFLRHRDSNSTLVYLHELNIPLEKSLLNLKILEK